MKQSDSCLVVSDSFVTPWNVARQVPLSIEFSIQARILEWVAISFSRGTSWTMNGIESPALQADSLLSELPGKPW